MAVVPEEDFVGIKTDEVYIHSVFCVKIAEPEVSLFLDKFLHACAFFSPFFLSFYLFCFLLFCFVV